MPAKERNIAMMGYRSVGTSCPPAKKKQVPIAMLKIIKTRTQRVLPAKRFPLLPVANPTPHTIAQLLAPSLSAASCIGQKLGSSSEGKRRSDKRHNIHIQVVSVNPSVTVVVFPRRLNGCRASRC